MINSPDDVGDRHDSLGDVTVLLESIESGDGSAGEQLFQIVYGQLRDIACRHMRHENSDHTLQATALVHEAWIKLVGSSSSPAWKNRGHFFATASRAMRRILVDAARSRQRQKRGGKNASFEIREEDAVSEQDQELIALDEALEMLKDHDSVKAELVTMRFFGGFTNKQAAEQLGISTATADRYWTYARAWLRNCMRD